MNDDQVEIKLDLDDDTLDNLNKIVAQGILGNTIDAVVEHMLRQHLFELENKP